MKTLLTFGWWFGNVKDGANLVIIFFALMRDCRNSNFTSLVCRISAKPVLTVFFQELIERRRRKMKDFQGYRQKKNNEYAQQKVQRLELRNGKKINVFPNTL